MKHKLLLYVQLLGLAFVCGFGAFHADVDCSVVSNNTLEQHDDNYYFDSCTNNGLALFTEVLNSVSAPNVIERTQRSFCNKLNPRVSIQTKSYNSASYYSFNFLNSNSFFLKYESQSDKLVYLRRIRI